MATPSDQMYWLLIHGIGLVDHLRPQGNGDVVEASTAILNKYVPLPRRPSPHHHPCCPPPARPPLPRFSLVLA